MCRKERVRLNLFDFRRRPIQRLKCEKCARSPTPLRARKSCGDLGPPAPRLACRIPFDLKSNNRTTLTTAAVVLSQRNPRMARGTQRQEIYLVVRAAIGERLDVVYLLRRGNPPVTLAQFAQRMRRDVAVADTFPRTAVAFARLGVAPVPFVFPRVPLGVGFAESAVRQRRTAGLLAWLLWFSRHCRHLRIEKAAAVFAATAVCNTPDYNYTHIFLTFKVRRAMEYYVSLCCFKKASISASASRWSS